MLYLSFETRFCKRFPNFSKFIMDKVSAPLHSLI